MAGEQNQTAVVPQRSPGQLGRDQIARVVVVASFLAVFLLVGVIIALAKYDTGAAASGVAEKAFNAILPVLAGWVGTVLAFYFSSASQEHTTDLLGMTIKRATGRPGDGTLVAEKMIPLAKILGLKDLNDTRPEGIKLSELRALFERDGTITRLVFLDRGVFKYLLHVGTLNAYLVKTGINPEDTLATLLKDPKTSSEISNLVAFVSVSTTLADAKDALGKVSGAQDIIVTATGSKTEQVVGWLTNVDLTKALIMN